MSPRFWPSQLSKTLLGTVLSGLCLSSYAQNAPLETPKKVEYPGIIQTFEKLIQVDNDKFKKRSDDLIKNGRVFDSSKSVTGLELEPDFLNSIILHSDPGYLRMASTDKCRFYEAVLTDLLRSSEGKIKNVLMTYVDKDVRQSAIINKKDFLNKVVNQECPDTQKMISLFQIKTLNEALQSTLFEIPSGREQCRNIHLGWVNNPKTPFLCQIYEYTKEARLGLGDPKDLTQRRAVAKILEEKQSLVQKDYIENVCKHLDDEELFCDEFLNVSFWTKVSAGYESKTYAEDICRFVTGTPALSPTQYNVCLARLKKENDLCLYPAGTNSGLRPQPECDQLSTALNFSSLSAEYKDCPGNSDQLIVTQMGRLINFFTPNGIKTANGPCTAISAATTFNFNKNFDNEENWKLEACYDDQINSREVCFKTFFGKYNNQPESYTSVVAKILQNTRGADPAVGCEMVDSQEYNPLLLQYKSGCYIIYERDKCFISQCKHKILFNDRAIDFIKIKNRVNMAYFPLTVRDERFSQNSLLTRDFKKTGRIMNNLSSIQNYFKKSKSGIIHGIGCAEDILPSFFKVHSINQCSPMPFIINGIMAEKGNTVFVVRTALDSLQAPRLISWSSIYSGVKSYQRLHPLKLWTMYGLD
ncbi:hypothetical protein ACJVC5_07095 [Peredibacter sp. HCB2-198]|uniref:hypothetical protein n=1 Tax=Peredibacter sp. HCB2-198 TaxID=3383025 RepID=UPI0038B4DFF9